MPSLTYEIYDGINTKNSRLLATCFSMLEAKNACNRFDCSCYVYSYENGGSAKTNWRLCYSQVVIG